MILEFWNYGIMRIPYNRWTHYDEKFVVFFSDNSLIYSSQLYTLVYFQSSWSQESNWNRFWSSREWYSMLKKLQKLTNANGTWVMTSFSFFEFKSTYVIN